jgi:CHRD domain
MLDARRYAYAAVLLAPLLAGVTCGTGFEDIEEETRAGELVGSAVVPPVETTASGHAAGTIFGNSLSIQGTFKDLSSPLLPENEGPVLLRLGEAGTNGQDILVIPAGSVDGRTGTFEHAVLVENEIVEAFVAGRTYVEIRTEDHPEGEVRAQLR